MILRLYIKKFYIAFFYFKILSNSLKSWCNIAEKIVNFKQNLKVTRPISLVCNKVLSLIFSSLLWKASDATRCDTLLYFCMGAVLQCSEICVHEHVWGKYIYYFNQNFFQGF